MADSAPDSLLFARFTKVIAVLDVVESVRLMEHDEHGFIRRWHSFVEYARQLVPQHGGRMHKSLGDGLMLEFADARGCVTSLFAMHDWWQRGNEQLPRGRQMQLRAGAHLASFVSDTYDIYGTDVNLTARIATLAGPGETVITTALRDSLADGVDADIEDLGECFLKHVKEPVRAFRVGEAGPSPIIDHGENPSELRPTVAVIPFAMRGGEGDHMMLGEALADEIITGLSRSPELNVISRLSTTVFSGRDAGVSDLGRRLGANYLLTGRCLTAGNELRLYVELVDVKTEHVLWADSHRGRTNGVFATDDDLINGIIASVSSAIIKFELKRAGNQALPNLAGYTLLLGAVGLMHRHTRDEFARSRELLEHLAERERRHPLPHAWLAQWHVLNVQQGRSGDRAKDARLALDCTRRALDSAPDCALAMTSEGFVYTNLLCNLDEGARRYDEALEINPNDSLAWLLKGTLLAFKGEGEEAIFSAEKALSLSPFDPLRYFYDSLAATAALSAQDYVRARELARRSLRANRLHASTLRALIVAEVALNNLDEARAWARTLLELDPGFTIKGFIDRSPSTSYATGPVWAKALREAGIPP